MTALAILASLIAAAFFAPGLYMLWAITFGAHFTETQGTGAFVLMFPGTLIGFGAALAWSEVMDR